MTFGDMLQALYDRLGLTGETDLAVRLINNGKDRYETARKWPFLETSTTQLFTSGTRTYLAPSNCRHILSIEGPSGLPLDSEVERETYDALYRADTSTATVPTVYREQGTRQTDGSIYFQVWPNPSTNTSGTIRFLQHVPDLSSADTASSYYAIPSAHHFAILEFAEASFHEYEDSQQAQFLYSKALDSVNRLAGSDVEGLPMQENN